ncbi:MAG: PEP-CTERM sorting domain-containing protein [Gammaproteobacteria bacterium]
MCPRSAVLLSAAVLASAAAHAQTVTASAALTGFRYELIDLDPSDGVTPEVSFTHFYQTQLIQRAPGSEITRDQAGAGALSLANAFGSLDASAAGVDASAAGSANLSAPTPATFLANGIHKASFSLTRATAILFSADAVLTAGGNVGNHEVSAIATMFADLQPYQSIGYWTFNRQEILRGSGSRSLTLSGELRSGADAVTGYFFSSAYVDYASAAPVPEPASGALLIAGLALLGWRMRGSRNLKPH